MFENIENIKLLFSSCGERKERAVSNRRGHVLVFRITGCGMHKFQKKSIISPPGSITFIPEGSSYTFEPVGDEPCSSVSVVFFADINDPQPVSFNDTSGGMQNIALNIYKHYRLCTPYSKHICMSFMYSMFAYLVNQESLSYSNKRKLQIIEPAIKYINDNIYSPNLKLDNLHCRCGISLAYFRKIFKSNFGMTPQKYIEEKRLEYAFSLITNNTYSISEISEMSGYNDPLYFSKVFKKKYGMSPSHVYKNINF